MPRSSSIHTVRNVVSAILLGMLLNWPSVAVAGPRGPIEGEPKKPYGAVDVIMYQTSW
jgi:hypothetical protein